MTQKTCTKTVNQATKTSIKHSFKTLASRI